MRIGVDTGGTFTDFVALDENGRITLSKSSTTPRDLTQGILNCFAKAGFDKLTGVKQVLHGSTTAINTIIQRVGAKTVLLTTRGMRDVYEIGRGNRPESYNLFFHRPRPVVTREWRLEVTERITAKGDVLTPLDENEVKEIAQRLKAEGIEAVAVCLLHSYVNPIHEQRVGEILRRELPEVFITLSHELMRQIREYERTSTTVLNAYVGPVVSRYIDNLAKHLRQSDLSGPVLIMQSNGGVMSTEVAKRQPIATTESGPVSGVIGAGQLARMLDMPVAIAFDMGGTTAKTAFIENGVVPVAPGCYIGGYETGQPMMLPVVDIIEVGAGGGSIAWLDEVGMLSVGPRSAGADPGPVCYGQGGTEPTVTDANLLLGRLNPHNFLGGEMQLQVEPARAALKRQVADPKELSLDEAADTVIQIVTANMALAVRKISVERGIDPRDCAIIAFGGAGPLHAIGVAKELQIPRVIIPPMPGHFSALGMMAANLRHDYVQTYFHDLESANMADIVAHLRQLEQDARDTLISEGADEDTIRYSLNLQLRYKGQDHVLPVPVTFAELETGKYPMFAQRYDGVHLEQYGHNAPGEPVELVNLQLTASGRVSKEEPALFTPIPGQSGKPKVERRSVYLGTAWGWREVDIYRRDELGAGFVVDGPSVIEEKASTTVIFPGDRLVVDELGNLVVEVS